MSHIFLLLMLKLKTVKYLNLREHGSFSNSAPILASRAYNLNTQCPVKALRRYPHCAHRVPLSARARTALQHLNRVADFRKPESPGFCRYRFLSSNPLRTEFVL